MSEDADNIQRYDVLIVSQARDLAIVDQGTRSLINYLVANNLVRPYAESVAEDWTEVYGKPGPQAHETFTRGGYSGDYEPFLEVTVRTGKKPVVMPFGGVADETTCFFVLFRGALWNELAPKLKNRMNKLVMTRCEVHVREHVGPIPGHREVSDDELPEEKKFARKDNVTPRVGTAVEEF